MERKTAMIIVKHELRTGKITLLIWSAAIAFLLAVCVLIYPEMEDQMGEISDTFAGMGSFSQAFGMDRINFGEFVGFFGVECGNILGLGGAFFAALTGIMALAKEEKEHTAEFLLTHPQSRAKIITQKLLAVFLQIVILNVTVIAATALSILVIGEKPDTAVLALFFLAYFILQLETAAICFGVSAFLRRGGFGIGLGIAAVFYFINIIANMSENAGALKYLTPFGYTEGADIIADRTINGSYLAAGILFAAAGIAAAYVRYGKKDIM